MPTDAKLKPLTRARRADFSTRAEGEELIIEGYFIVWDQPYYIDEYMEEIIERGAIDDGTDTSDVRALVDHLPHLVLGRANNTVHTLQWRLDDTGLWASIRINPTDTDAVNLHSRVQRGDVDQASFGFDEDTVTFTDLPDGRIRRTIQHLSKLWEITVCTFPAYEQTYVSARDRLSGDLRRELTRAQKEKLKRRLKHNA